MMAYFIDAHLHHSASVIIGKALHICVYKTTPLLVHVISWGVLSTGTLGTNYSAIEIKTLRFSVKNAYKNVFCKIAAFLC